MDRWRSLLAAAVTVGCLSCVLTGCAGGSSAPAAPTATDSSPAVTAASGPTFGALVWRSREDEAAGHRLQVKLTNTSPGPVTVTGLRLLGGGFTELGPTDKDVRFAAGERFDLQVPIGAARCDDTAVGPAAAEVAWADDVGGSGRFVVAAQVQDDVLRRARTAECAAERVGRTVAVALVVDPGTASAAPAGSGPGARVPGALRLTRTGGSDPVAVSDLSGSVVIDLRPRTEWPATLAADRDRLDVPLLLGAATCDGHRLGETKKPFVFLAYVAIGDSAPVPIAVDVDGPTRVILQDLLSTVCQP